MEDRTFEAIRLLPRSELESFALTAAQHLSDGRREIQANRVFLALLSGFLVGTLVASAAFLLGSSLG